MNTLLWLKRSHRDPCSPRPNGYVPREATIIANPALASLLMKAHTGGAVPAHSARREADLLVGDPAPGGRPEPLGPAQDRELAEVLDEARSDDSEGALVASNGPEEASGFGITIDRLDRGFEGVADEAEVAAQVRGPIKH